MADDCSFHAVGGPDLLGKSFNRAGMPCGEGFQLAWHYLPDAAWIDGDHFVVGDRGVSESTFVGTKAGWYAHQARMVDVFTFKMERYWLKTHFVKTGHLFLLNEC